MDAQFTAQEAREEETRKFARAEMRARVEAEEKRVKEKAAAKKLEEELKQQVLEQQERDERTTQEMLWKEAGATTLQEKQEICLHSRFWPKVVQKKKIKCQSCGQRRGMTAFKCPHCELLACQLCNAEFRKSFESRE